MPQSLVLTATLAVLFALGTGCTTPGGPRKEIRIDATSAESAEATFKAMVDDAPPRQREKLLGAMIAINFAGIQSAYEVVRDPSLESVSIGRIKEQVAGMTADEILAYAEKVSTVQMEVRRR